MTSTSQRKCIYMYQKIAATGGPSCNVVFVYWHHVLANHQSFACAWIHAFLSGRCQSAPFILPLLSFACTFPNTNIKNNHYYNMCCLHALFFPETYSCSPLVAFTILTACHSMHLSSRVTRCCNSFPCFLCTLIGSCRTNTVSYQAFLNVRVWLKWVCCLLLSNMKECDAETAHLIGAVSCAFFVYNRLQTFHPICTETGTQ